MKKLLAILFLLTAMLLNNIVFADDTELVGLDENAIPDISQSETTQEDWHFIAGTGPVYLPHYEGASAYWLRPVPLFRASKGNFFAGTLGGIGYHFINEKTLKFGMRIGAAPGRNESVDARLAGMGDLKPAGELGLFVKAKFDNTYFIGNVMAGSRGRRAELGGGYDFSLKDFSDYLRVGVNANWASADYMQAYFGVSPQQSITSGLSAYDAAAGIRSYALLSSWTHIFDRHCLGNLAVVNKHLAGSALNSPLVQTKSAYSVSYVVLYLF
jgi:outer membrane protein